MKSYEIVHCRTDDQTQQHIKISSKLINPNSIEGGGLFTPCEAMPMFAQYNTPILLRLSSLLINMGQI